MMCTSNSVTFCLHLSFVAGWLLVSSCNTACGCMKIFTSKKLYLLAVRALSL